MRQKNSIYNVIGSIGYYIFAIIFNLVNHAVLVRLLGIEYSGINGLFTNVLSLLSVVELGVGNVIIFKLYEPIANNDIEKIKSWLNFYKKCYNIITIVILIIGISISPFIKNIIGNPENIPENIYILYFISLSSVLSSYLVSYKRSILNASQKNYVVSIINIVYLIILNIMQIIILIIFKNYIMYLGLKTICILLSNIYLNFFVNKHYPYVKDSFTPISKKEKKNVIIRIKAIFFEKVSYVVNKGIDNILITKYLGVAIAGYYSNYHLISITLVNILFKAFVSMIPSVGNLLVEKRKNKNYEVFKKMFYLNSYLVGLFSICFFTTINSFITIWVGEKYLLSFDIVMAFSIYIIVDGIRYSIMSFRDGAGICVEDKNNYIIAVIINLFSSILLCKHYGMIGVIFGTALAYIFLDLYSYPRYTFKKLFNQQLITYYKLNGIFLVKWGFGIIISFLLTKIIEFNNSFLNFIIYSLISIIIWSILFIITSLKTDEFRYYYSLIKKVLRRKNDKDEK